VIFSYFKDQTQEFVRNLKSPKAKDFLFLEAKDPRISRISDKRRKKRRKKKKMNEKERGIFFLRRAGRGAPPPAILFYKWKQ
jgi:hypothetical protein